MSEEDKTDWTCTMQKRVRNLLFCAAESIKKGLRCCDLEMFAEESKPGNFKEVRESKPKSLF